MRSAVAARTLVACLGRDGAPSRRGLEGITSQKDLTGLAELAKLHGVVPALRGCLEQAGVESTEIDRVTRQQLTGAACDLMALRALSAAGTTLDSGRVPWLVFKGPVLSRCVYARAGQRSYGDLDVLVSPLDLRRAIEVLEDAGFSTERAEWRESLEWGSSEVPVMTPNGYLVDLHWNVVNGSKTRSALGIPTAELFARSVPSSLGDVEVLTFGTTDTLVHLAVHATTSGANRLCWMKDIEQAIEHLDIDWPDVVERAHSFGVGLATAVALRRARDTLGARVPSETLRRLDPARLWSSFDRLLCRFRPIERGDGAESLTRLYARSTRRSLGSSTVQLVRSVWRGSVDRLRKRPPRGPDEQPERSREDYLRWVEQLHAPSPGA